MTKAEAIEVLKNTAWLGTDIHMSKVDNALRVIEQENISCDAVNIWSGHTTKPNETVFDFSDGTRKAVKVVEDRREQEPCDDAISRDAVYEILMRSDFSDTCSYETFKKRLDALPSVTQKSETVTEFADRCRECGARYGKLLKQKSGKWIDTDEWCETVDGFEQWGYFRKCSKCGYVFKFLEIDNYCPNCGAKMESEE